MLDELGEQELRHVLFLRLLETLPYPLAPSPADPSPSESDRRRSCRTTRRAPAWMRSRTCARDSCARWRAPPAPRRFRTGRIWRPATTTLAARRLRSHSQGAGRVSSKSLMSKMMRRSGVAKPPKFDRWASPQACTRIPETGVDARSAAMMRGRAAIEGERRLHHAAEADRHQLRHPALVRLIQEIDDVAPVAWRVSNGRAPRAGRPRAGPCRGHGARRAVRIAVLRGRRMSAFSWRSSLSCPRCRAAWLIGRLVISSRRREEPGRIRLRCAL